MYTNPYPLYQSDRPSGGSLMEPEPMEDETNDLYPEEELQKPKNFNDNLAESMTESELTVLSGKLIEGVDEDKESRRDWESTIDRVMKHLGFKIEEARNAPFMRACAAYDTTLASSLMHFWATARAELFPAAGPAKSEILGQITADKEDQAERIKKFLNYYLTQIDKPYYPDSDKLLLYTGFFGTAFRKVYMDPILNRPVGRLVKPQDLIVNNHAAASLLESSRITHVMEYTRKEILLNQGLGVFRDVDLPEINDEDEDEGPINKSIKRMEGINTSGTENKDLFKFYEIHADLNLEDEDEEYKKDAIPLPYRVTICEANKKIVSIKRNWKEGDPTFAKRVFFEQYSYLPGFGLYSLGLAHLIGSNAMTLTQIQRQLIDAGTLKNFPGGLKTAGLKIKNNDKAIGPNEFWEVETGGIPIQQAIMLMPYSEPSIVLKELRKELIQETQQLVATGEVPFPEGRNDAPVGTTLALLEVKSRLESSIMRSLHVSLGNELKLFFNCFAENLGDTPYPFSVPGGDSIIMRQDFNDKISVVPVSDPNVITTTHRLLRAEALLKLAQSNPQIHDLREAYHRMYASMNIPDIDKLLPKPPVPQPLDPISENMLILSGKPIEVAMFQDDDAHNVNHKKLLGDPIVLQNPGLLATITLHIQKHEAQKIFKMMHQQKQEEQAMQTQSQLAAMQQQIGYMTQMGQFVPPEMMQQAQNLQAQAQMPATPVPQIPIDQLMTNPEIQNILAKQDAERTLQEQQKAAEAQAEAANKQIDPNQVMLADIEQRREAAHLKDEEGKLKAETEAFKAQLKFESEKAKMESVRETAIEKNQVAIALEQMKHPNNQIPLE